MQKRVTPTIAYICLGSNIGETKKHLVKTVENIAAIQGVTVTAVSNVYLTEPQNLRDQPFFANQVIQISVDHRIGALELFTQLQLIETLLGRSRQANDVRFGPRIIDIDLLLFGSLSLKKTTLTLPHPRMEERAFVLVPLAELAPAVSLESGNTVESALANLDYQIKNNVIYQS